MYSANIDSSILKETAKYGLRFFLLRCGYRYQHFNFENRSTWFASNYLSVNAKKTQAMILVSTPMNLLFILATLLSE